MTPSFKDPECTQPKWQLVPYFCGQDPRCRKKEQWAVDKAKENIEQYYVAVGIGTCIFVGYIEIGDGCRRPNVLTTTLRCW